MKFNPEENDINEVVKEAGDTMKLLADEKGLEFNIELGDGLPKIRFDRDKISEVLINILNNAIKFTETGGVSIATCRDGNCIRVSVRDTGPGVDGRDMHNLFSRYWHGAKKTGGAGLGLAISKQIIDAHEGNIWAESELGKGSTFYFTLPARQ